MGFNAEMKRLNGSVFFSVIKLLSVDQSFLFFFAFTLLFCIFACVKDLSASKLIDSLSSPASLPSPQDLTALAKELRAVDDVRPPHKVTDYSSSSEDSGTTDEEDDEEVDQEAGEESTSGAEDSRAG